MQDIRYGYSPEVLWVSRKRLSGKGWKRQIMKGFAYNGKKVGFYLKLVRHELSLRIYRRDMFHSYEGIQHSIVTERTQLDLCSTLGLAN